MSEIIRRTLKVLAYASAAVVVLLAILLGLFRLFLPRLPEYQDELKAWASEAIGMEVEFAGMDARWGLRGPELSFYDAELVRPATGTRAIAASEVGIIVSLPQLLFEQILVVDTVRVQDSSVELRETADGEWQFQGEPLRDLFPRDRRIDSITVIGENIDLLLLRTGDQRPTRFVVRRVDAVRNANRTAIDADLRLPPELGSAMTLSVMQRTGIDAATSPWNLSINAAGLQLAGWSALYRHPARRVTAGQGSVDLSFAVQGDRLQNASATTALQGVSLNGGPAFDIAGRAAWNDDAAGWLLALDELQVTTSNGAWPLSSFRIEERRGTGSDPASFDVRAAHANLADAGMVAPWLDADARAWLDEWRPDGVVHNVVMTIVDPGADKPGYAVSAEFERAGFAARGDLPGIRGFSGSLRADPDGGLLAIDATDVILDAAAWVPEAIELDNANGTVVWRRSDGRLTVLSDNVSLGNAVFDSRSSVEVSIDGENAPVVDLSSDWRIADVAVAKRFIPQRVMSPKLYQWFQDALVAGRIPAGSASLRGALDAFPFDGGEGRLHVEATVEALDFRYHPEFPLVDVESMDVVLDNTHLYTYRNRAATLGNAATDARVDIRDLREPVLTIEAGSNGTLQSLHAFAAASPIARLFGGHLDKVSVAGAAEVALDLTIPIRQWRGFELTARVESDDGRLAVSGLKAPFTELTGAVTIERDHIESDGLSGQFLGAPVEIELRDAGAEAPGYRIIADVRGTATAAALVAELGLPLAGEVSGQAAFAGQVRFPQADAEPPVPFAVHVDSDLAGLAFELPAPFEKPAAERRDFSADLVFEPGGGRIESSGQAGDELAFSLAFSRTEDAWDFDRGMLTLGGILPVAPDVRGLHVRGRLDELEVAGWLALGQGEGLEAGAGERIRSVDLEVGELVFLGQRLADHRLQVDRSARDWLVQITGADVTGSIFVPYEFSSASTLVLDMERLVLPGDAANESDAPRRETPAPLDPRSLPAISLRAAEFGLGERRFGNVVAEFTHDGNGLVADSIVATDATFRIEGSAIWRADPNDPLGSRSSLATTLESTDVEATLERLGYQPGIESESMRMELDMNWSGGPHAEFLRTLDGSVAVELGTGQLNEVEPGAGRVFGLLSIVALPRRLSLDFRDVFQKGFGFDEISGTFRLDNGSAYTCDLSLVGPAADIGITGQADLVAGNYSQAAVVSANLGNTLPVVGALAAGPQVAAALFLFSQIFKKPLKEVGQVYYSMTGSWEHPNVESTDAEAFAATAALAGCLTDADNE